MSLCLNGSHSAARTKPRAFTLIELLVVVAIGSFPALLVATLLALLIAMVVAWLFGLGLQALRDGGPTCTAVLATLALGVFAPAGGSPMVHVVLAAPLAVLLFATLENPA